MRYGGHRLGMGVALIERMSQLLDSANDKLEFKNYLNYLITLHQSSSYNYYVIFYEELTIIVLRLTKRLRRWMKIV